jgi:hypothetical protein
MPVLLLILTHLQILEMVLHFPTLHPKELFNTPNLILPILHPPPQLHLHQLHLYVPQLHLLQDENPNVYHEHYLQTLTKVIWQFVIVVKGLLYFLPVYPLLGGTHGAPSCRIKANKLQVVTRSFGFTHKVFYKHKLR